jgi:4-methyl-5(b-hydroxyethyl)-thiazole monophosphate biosynthesis
MPRALIPLADGFEEIEAMTVVDVLRRAEFKVVLAGLHGGPVESVRKVTVIPDATIDAMKSDDFDMIILPGGQPGTTNLSADVRVIRLLKEFNRGDKLIGAICAATTLLSQADLIRGKRVTAYPDYRDKLPGAQYVESAVVIDGKIITSQGPGTAMEFALAIVSRYAGRHTADEIADKMLVGSTGRNLDMWDRYLFNATVQSLVEALELKGSYSQGHAKRVTEYCLCMGAKLKLPATEMRDLYLGSMLHDIGMVATESDLLNKPAGLDLREETIMREHPIKGTLFIVGFDNLSGIVPTILHHHEQWDGSGYPARLKETQIPLHARIVCLADSFAAMLFPRSFRPAMEKEQAIQEIRKQRGAQFDPDLVDILLECLAESPFEMKDFSFYF